MNAKLTDELRQAMQQQPDRPLEIRDDQTNTLYVLMTRDQFQKLVYDDSELTGDEMLAAAAAGLDDPEGWGAPGMEVYDQLDLQSPN